MYETDKKFDDAMSAVYATALHGHEKLNDIIARQAQAPVVATYQARYAERMAMRREIERLYGPDAPYMYATYLQRDAKYLLDFEEWKQGKKGVKYP